MKEKKKKISPIKDFNRLQQGRHSCFNGIENENFKYLNRYKILLSFNTNCTHLVPIHIKITSVVTLKRTPSDTLYQKYVALVALLFFIYLVNFTMLHYTPEK